MSPISEAPTKAQPSKASRVPRQLPPYRHSLAGRLLAARIAVMVLIRPILRDADITEQQWRVLRVLIDEGAIDASAVASGALLRPASVTRILRELQARKLVKREADPTDARRSILRVSPTGRALVDETVEVTFQMLSRHTAAFGSKRLQSLMSELAFLTEKIKGPGELFGD